MTLGLVVAIQSPASAIPILQLYVEGGTYDTDTETWIAPTGEDPIRLWAIGNIDGPGGKGTISDVKLSVAYDSGDEPVTITLTPSTTANFGGFTDLSPATSPLFLQTVIDGSSPVLGDGSALPSHGVYGAGTNWQEFGLGNYATADSPIGDFINTLPTPTNPNSAMINVYEVTVSGPTEDIDVHFDLYNGVESGNHIKFKFAPFSHDGGGTGGGDGDTGGGDGDTGGGPPLQLAVPEPSTLMFAAVGLVAIICRSTRRRRV